MKPAADKHFRCTICQRGFTRIDHLKRHHLRHSGLKPYSCVFCDESFARCDNLRDHYPDCAQRGSRPIPETGQRGRRRHACESCTSMKLRCDGESPCGSCIKRKLKCNNQRKKPSKEAMTEKGPSLAKREEYDQSSDRGSIKFLLNGGTDSFTEKFLLPPCSERTRGLVYHTKKEWEESPSPTVSYGYDGVRTDYAPAFIDADPGDLGFFHDTFINFFNGPFGETQKSLYDPLTGGLAYRPIVPPGQDPNLTLPGETIYEPEAPFATALIQSILTKVWTVSLDTKAQEEISTNLHFLLTPGRIRKFIQLYFKHWHPHCPVIHPPSFDPDHVPTSLLASVVFMGAMYSTDERESYAAKRVLDFAELFVFSTEAFACENEIARVFTGTVNPDLERGDWLHFQHFQAGYLMVVIQYWAGGRISRNRAMENRFGEIIKVARKLGLLKCRHLPEDRIHEYLWIQKESRIRTINVVSLLDCAFSFYQNYPCRLTHNEMECDLPCEESVFCSQHPFAEPNFRFTRNVTIREAFQQLFSEESANSKPVLGRSQSVSSAFTQTSMQNLEDLQLTVLDMFILIHLLYAFINSHMTLLDPFIRMRRAAASKAETPSLTDSSSSPSHQISMPDDSILGAIRTALARWRSVWLTLNSKVPSHEWAAMGFYKNGYNFWLVAQLLITKKDSLDVTMRMEVKCEDKLDKLKVLLQDD
ncbi:transcriptional regulator family: Fungal Specific TF and C2H2 zinc finger [Paecilomyces variotii]|nr:transcriptional regulator family: Fungal Specific TF and C2H2 zinc finger [Paecilomyces variotii]